MKQINGVAPDIVAYCGTCHENPCVCDEVASDLWAACVEESNADDALHRALADYLNISERQVN